MASQGRGYFRLWGRRIFANAKDGSEDPQTLSSTITSNTIGR